MRKKVCTLLAACAFALALSLPAATSAEPRPAPKAPAAKALNVPVPNQGERHPEIRDAISLLNRAQNRLNHAAHDFGGHRTAAMQHISKALEELNKALAYDKH